jgi:replicative DNA helicase
VAELQRQGQLESVDGMSFIVSLDEGLPDLPDISSYIRVVLEKAKLRQLAFLGQRLTSAVLDGRADSQEIVAHVTERLVPIQTGLDGGKGNGRSPLEVVQQYPGGAAAFLDPSQRKAGIMTPFTKLNELTNGLHANELIIIGARPGCGKSAFLLNILEHVCLKAQPRRFAALFSLEMNASSILTRLMCSLARVDAHKFRCGFLHKDERYALQYALHEITECKHLRIFDKFSMTVPEMCRQVKHMVKDDGLELAAIDYIQLATPVKKGENRNLEVSEMTRQLKISAGDNGITWIALSQLSRRNEQRAGGLQKPQLSDLRDSGAIEQDADSVFMLDREELRRKGKDEIKGQAELLIEKQREGPAPAVVPLRFLNGLVRFDNSTGEGTPEEMEPAATAPSFHEKEGW